MPDDEPPAPPERTDDRADFPVWRAMPTRWADNDQYGHANNVVYYSWFDTAVNGWLIEALGHDVRDLPALGVVAQTSCRFLSPVGFPDALEIGLRVERLGSSSVTYALGVFRDGASDPSAVGRFVHVYVDPATRRPVGVPDAVREVVERVAGERVAADRLGDAPGPTLD